MKLSCFHVFLLVSLLGAGSVRAAPSANLHDIVNIPGGFPLDLLFASCDGFSTSGDADIGPCLALLLNGTIEATKPNFATGVKIGRKVIVLEPFSLDDIEEKEDKEFKFSASDLKIHNISTISVENITFDSETLALSLAFQELRATAKLGLKYLFLTASPDVQLALHQLRVHITANWTFEDNREEEQLDMVLSNAEVKLDLGDISAKIDGLGGLGSFLERILNRNSQSLVNFLVPSLEKSATEKLNEDLNRIKIAE